MKQTQRYALTESDIRNNRQALIDMWKTIPAEWINLDILFDGSKGGQEELLTLEELGTICYNAQNPCGAVGCLFGWSITHSGYQAWCTSQNLCWDMTDALEIWLGLPSWHTLFDEKRIPWLSHEKELRQRLDELRVMPIVLR